METEIFKEEAYELLDEMEQVLLDLRDSPDSQELINRLFRAMHTIKGSGAMYGFDRVASFAHGVETVLDAVRNGQIPVSTNLLEAILVARDHLLQMIGGVDPESATLQAESEKLVVLLKSFLTPSAPPQRVAPIEVKLSPPPERLPSPPPGHPRILVVEDEFISRCLLQEFLSSRGTVHVAVDGFEAVMAFKMALAEKRPYDLVCLDIFMPGMDGRAVAKELRRLEEVHAGQRSRIIMTTALSDGEVVTELFQTGMCDAYLVKPLRLEKLTELITQYFAA